MKKTGFLKKGDIIILLAVVLLCAALFVPKVFYKSENKVAKVYENGVLTHEIALDTIKTTTFVNITGGVLQVEKGRICYKEANCKDKCCVRFSWLSKSGDMASCLPNKTVVVITTDTKGIDVITY